MKFSKNITELFNEFKEKFDFELDKTWPYEVHDRPSYIVFKRHADDDECMHTIILENHTWELNDPDFDPKHDIGDWLIFSSRRDDDDPDNENEFQYPLTLSEYRFIERIIQALDAEFPREQYFSQQKQHLK